MSFDLFQEGGPLKTKKTGQNEYSMAVSLPKDEEGRTARACPSQHCSPGYFKVTPGTGITADHKITYCPYCRKAAEASDFHTKEQIRYAKDLIEGQA